MEVLGDLYERGDGFQADARKAVEWYLCAVEGEKVESMLRLGICYGLGSGVDMYLVKAALFYKRAANTGDPESVARLAGLYEPGLGVHRYCPGWGPAMNGRGMVRREGRRRFGTKGTAVSVELISVVL